LPDSILYPETFDKSKPAGFNGIFDWSWTKGCFGNTNIKPMDFDAVVERFRHYLVMESKEEGKEIPQGQLITLNNLYIAKDFHVMKIWGKYEPKEFIIRYPTGKEKIYHGVDSARNFVIWWFEKANKNK